MLKNVTVRYPQRFLGLFLVAVLFISSSSIGLAFSASSSSTNIESCNETQILGVSASASDTNFPASGSWIRIHRLSGLHMARVRGYNWIWEGKHCM